MIVSCILAPRGWLHELMPYGEALSLVWEPDVVRRVTLSVQRFVKDYIKGKLVRERGHVLQALRTVMCHRIRNGTGRLNRRVSGWKRCRSRRP
jgi:hypothetical protein